MVKFPPVKEKFDILFLEAFFDKANRGFPFFLFTLTKGLLQLNKRIHSFGEKRPPLESLKWHGFF